MSGDSQQNSPLESPTPNLQSSPGISGRNWSSGWAPNQTFKYFFFSSNCVFWRSRKVLPKDALPKKHMAGIFCLEKLLNSVLKGFLMWKIWFVGSHHGEGKKERRVWVSFLGLTRCFPAFPLDAPKLEYSIPNSWNIPRIIKKKKKRIRGFVDFNSDFPNIIQKMKELRDLWILIPIFWAFSKNQRIKDLWISILIFQALSKKLRSSRIYGF